MLSPRRAATAVAVVVLLAVGCGGGEGGGPDDVALGGASDPPRTKLVAALGDSITAGSPLWDPDPAVRDRIGGALDERSQYEYWARRRLPDTTFRNCGVFGERTDEIAARLDACAEDAEVLIVQGGINDIAQRRPVRDAARDLRAMVERGQELGLRVALVEVLPWSNGYPAAAGPIRRLNEQIAAIGRDADVPVLPWYETLEDPRAPGRIKPGWTIDGDHPSLAGYRRLGETVELP